MGFKILAQMETNLPEMQETQVGSLGWEDPLEKEMAVFLPGKSHGQRSPEGLHGMGHAKSQTRLERLTLMILRNSPGGGIYLRF